MKKVIVFLISMFFTFSLYAQGIIGAWETTSTSKNGEQLKNVVIFAESYHVSTTYNATSGEFVSTKGGSWTLEGDMMTKKIEFHTVNPELVGTEKSFKIRITDSTIENIDSSITLDRLDDGSPGKLQGAWLMSGRVRDGKTQERNIDRPRKTMKILSGTRFQWIAYNTETKQFMGTGGGTYTTINDEYTENIEFFSKDDSRVGASLKFNFELIDGKWHHTGFSSKGDPLHEIWSTRK